ncbi:hypothetical protein GCM10009691_09560 [Brevibacterium picturae]|uniref:Uncharacterized protein n=1 Tax=Brevibacterium picturae TaxID=260553 RepID=A0ABN2BAX8_9MICO
MSADREALVLYGGSSARPDQRNRTVPGPRPADRDQNHTGLVQNHMDQDLPNHLGQVQNHTVLALNHTGQDRERSHKEPTLPAVDRGRNRKDRGRNRKGREQNHRGRGLPNRQGRRTHRARMFATRVPRRKQAQVRWPAPGRTAVGCSAQDSARADHATAVVLIQLGAAANSSLTPVARGDRVVKLHVSVWFPS